MDRMTRCALRVPDTLRPAWHRSWQFIQQTLPQRLIPRHRPSEENDKHSWPRAGSLWLGIGGLLLAALMQAT